MAASLVESMASDFDPTEYTDDYRVAVMAMIADLRRFVETWLPCFEASNRSYLTVAIGCTGGQHRSVFLSEWLAREFAGRARVLVRHRELS